LLLGQTVPSVEYILPSPSVSLVLLC